MGSRNWELQCKVYVGNIGKSAAKQDLEDLFSKYGVLRNVWIARNPPGFAFIEFDDPRDAEDAVRALDGTRFCDDRIRVEMSNGRSRGRGDRRPPPPRYRGRSPRQRSRSRSPRNSPVYDRYRRSNSRG